MSDTRLGEEQRIASLLANCACSEPGRSWAVRAIGCDTRSLFETFSEQAREAIGRAQDEARKMGHESVQVEHLLLGLFSDQTGIPGRVFADFGLTVEPVRGEVRSYAFIGRGEGGASEILRALGADPISIRFAAEKLASPTSVAGPVGQLRGTSRPIPPELEFRDWADPRLAPGPAGERFARSRCLTADGFANPRIPSEVGVAPMTVKAWRDRSCEDGLKEFFGGAAGSGAAGVDPGRDGRGDCSVDVA